MGVIEEVGVKGKKGFTNLDELWEILTPVENTPCKSRRTGNHVSDKYGIERRDEVRIKKEIPFVFIYKERNLNANTMNFSKNGLGIKISDNISMTAGDIVNLKVRDSDAKAQVIWVNTKAAPAFTMAGFRILNGRLSLNSVCEKGGGN